MADNIFMICMAGLPEAGLAGKSLKSYSFLKKAFLPLAFRHW